MQTLVNDTKSLCFISRFDSYERTIINEQINGKAREYEVTHKDYPQRNLIFSITKCFIIKNVRVQEVTDTMNTSIQYSYNKSGLWLRFSTCFSPAIFKVRKSLIPRQFLPMLDTENL